MSTFESKILQDFGITGREALKRGIIQPGKRINGRTGNLINDGWECIATGNNYDTQYEAVKAHFEYQAEQDAKAKEAWQNADLHWVVIRSSNGNTRHTLTEQKTGNILFNTGSRMRITDYLEQNPHLKFAKKVLLENQLAS